MCRYEYECMSEHVCVRMYVRRIDRLHVSVCVLIPLSLLLPSLLSPLCTPAPAPAPTPALTDEEEEEEGDDFSSATSGTPR